MAVSSTSLKPAPPVDQNAGIDAFARLTPFGWWGGLSVILVLLTASFLLAGYFLVYWRNADMDFMITYSALSLNDSANSIIFCLGKGYSD